VVGVGQLYGVLWQRSTQKVSLLSQSFIDDRRSSLYRSRATNGCLQQTAVCGSVSHASIFWA